MYRNVYYHKKTNVFENMIRLALNHSSIDMGKLGYMTDGQAFAALETDDNPLSKEIVEMVYANVPYDRVFTGYSSCPKAVQSFENFQSAEGLEDAIEKYASLEKGQVVVLLRNPAQKEPQFPMMLHTNDIVNVFEHNEKARNAAMHPESVFYAQIAVHPSVENSKKLKAKQMAEAIAKDF